MDGASYKKCKNMAFFHFLEELNLSAMSFPCRGCLKIFIILKYGEAYGDPLVSIPADLFEEVMKTYNIMLMEQLHFTPMEYGRIITRIRHLRM